MQTPRRAMQKTRWFVAWVLLKLGCRLRIRSKDRQFLEEQVLPYFVEHTEFQRILFVGCDWYTYDYRRVFRCKEYITLEIDPARAPFGARRHIVDSMSNIARHFKPRELDVILCNGVFGWGLNDREQVAQAFAGCYDSLRSGGVFVFGWDDVPVRRPFPPDELSELQRFSPWHFPPLGASRYRSEPDQHVYDFFCKP
jgi:SAM-dependent methyltransferase